jgi:hypothetical protein
VDHYNLAAIFVFLKFEYLTSASSFFPFLIYCSAKVRYEFYDFTFIKIIQLLAFNPEMLPLKYGEDIQYVSQVPTLQEATYTDI